MTRKGYVLQKEFELEQLQKQEEQERELLERLNEGLLDGMIGSGFNMGVFTSQSLIEDGRPMIARYLTEKGPVKDAMIIEKEFETDEGKLWFLRNHGWKMKDVYAQLYSRMYKRSGSLSALEKHQWRPIIWKLQNKKKICWRNLRRDYWMALFFQISNGNLTV